MIRYRAAYDEKRNHYRMELNCPIELKQPGDSNSIMGTCINLSARGMLLLSGEHYPPGTQLKIQVKPELSLSGPLQALIRVLRVDADEATSQYHLAAVIEEIET